MSEVNQPQQRQYTMSAAAREQRAAAAAKLVAMVEPEYFKWLGRRGGRKIEYQALIWLSQNWNFSPEQIAGSKVSERVRAGLVADMREHYRQMAEEKYQCFWGNRVLIELWRRDSWAA